MSQRRAKRYSRLSSERHAPIGERAGIFDIDTRGESRVNETVEQIEQLWKLIEKDAPLDNYHSFVKEFM